VIGDSDAALPLTASLADADPEMRRKAAWALGEIGDARAIEPLVEALEDTDEDVRRVSLLVLEKLGWKPPDEAQEIRELIASRQWDRLAGMGDVAIEALIETLRSGDEDARLKAAWALGEIGDRRGLDALKLALEDSEASVREKSAWALGEIGDPSAVDALVGVLEDEEDVVRQAASGALAMLGWKPPEEEVAEEIFAEEPAEEEVVTEVAAAAEPEAPVVEEAAAEPVQVGVAARPEPEEEGAGEEPAPEPARVEVSAKPPAAKAEEEEAEQKISDRQWTEVMAYGEAAVVPLIRALVDPDWSVRRKAAWVLGEIGEPAVEELLKVLESPDEDVRALAAEVLSRMGWETGKEVDEARRLIDAGEWDKVARIGYPAVGPLSRALTTSKDEEIRKQAAAVLGVLGDARGVEPLTGSLADGDVEVRKKAVWALGKIGGEGIVEPLVGSLRDENAEVRSKAARILDSAGWKASNSAEEAHYLIATKQWNKLMDLGAEAVEPLEAMLQDDDPEVRDEAQWLLNEIDSAKEMEDLFKSLKKE
jgi:HEAT repeat protein